MTSSTSLITANMTALDYGLPPSNTSEVTTALVGSLTDQERNFILALYFWLYGVLLCVISVVGITTNVANIYALSKTVSSNKRPMYHFLLCMALVDGIIMCILLARSITFNLIEPHLVATEMVWTEEEGIKTSYSTYFFWNTWYIPVNILITISNWCTVAMGTFRLVVVFAPLKASRLCTVFRAHVTIAVVVIYGVIVNMPAILEQSLVDGIFVSKYKIDVKYNMISAIISGPIPAFTCLIINSLLIYRIKQYRSKVKMHLFEGRQRGSTDDSAAKIQQQQQTQAEVTLISVSLFFVVMSIPNVVYYCFYYSEALYELSITSQNLFYMIPNLFIYVNHACNFFFYVLLNKPFRTFLWRKIKTKSASEGHGTRLSTLRTENRSLRKLATNTHTIINLLQNRADFLPTEQSSDSDDV